TYVDYIIPLVDATTKDFVVVRGVPLWDGATQFFTVGESFLFDEAPIQTFIINDFEPTNDETPITLVNEMDSDFDDVAVVGETSPEDIKSFTERLNKKIGERAWLAVPLTAEAQRLKVGKKFIPRWVGPVRIVDRAEGDAQTKYRVVERFPGNQIVVRTVHASRLRPFTARVPVDSAEDVMKLAGDDFETEYKKWLDDEKLTRRPTHKQQYASGASPWLLAKIDPNFSQEDIDNPKLIIDKILDVKKTVNPTSFEYLTSWEMWGRKERHWQREEDMPSEVISDFWEQNKRKYRPLWNEYKKMKERMSEKVSGDLAIPLEIDKTSTEVQQQKRKAKAKPVEKIIQPPVVTDAAEQRALRLLKRNQKEDEATRK
ncbi:hypothetical protein HDU79_001206, partial [Rhizoclosmatium sp. JEL0117]